MTCQKMTFDDNRAALKEMKIIKAENNRGGSKRKHKSNKKMSSYYCPDCDGWHLTTMPKNVLKLKGYKRK